MNEFPNRKIVVAIPASSGSVKLEEGEVDINIYPTTEALISFMNIKIINEPITIKFDLIMELNRDADILTYNINDDYEYDYDYYNLYLPDSILKTLAKQIGEHIKYNDMIIGGDHHSVFGTFNFNWNAYVII